jgi:DNA helicase HerA-like ATPase
MDEFQNFTTLSVANMISELRKFRVGLILANQHLSQLEPDIRSAVLGNAGTLVSFRLGAEDAAIVARELAPTFLPEDLIGLGNHSIYLRLMIDRVPSMPFSASTVRPDDLAFS